jgi:hypothetical protein
MGRHGLTITFTAPLEKFSGKGGWTFVRIPQSFSERLGMRGMVPVLATVEGHVFERSLMPIGDGTHMIAMNKSMLKVIGKQLPDDVTVHIAVQSQPHAVRIPEELAIAFDLDPDGKELFHALPRSTQRGLVMWLESARTDHTRANRAGEILRRLSLGDWQKRPHKS